MRHNRQGEKQKQCPPPPRCGSWLWRRANTGAFPASAETAWQARPWRRQGDGPVRRPAVWPMALRAALWGARKFLAWLGLWLTVCGSRTVSRVLSTRLPACDRHSSRSAVAHTLKQPTRKASAGPAAFPIWSCSERGMPSMPCHHGIWWSLTPPFHPYPAEAGRFAFCGAVRRLPSLDVIQRSALWSPDFPPRSCPRGDDPSDSRNMEAHG